MNHSLTISRLLTGSTDRRVLKVFKHMLDYQIWSMPECFTTSPFQQISDVCLTIGGMVITSNAHIGPTYLNVSKKLFKDFFSVLEPHANSLNCNHSVPSRKAIVVFKKMTLYYRLIASVGYTHRSISFCLGQLDTFKSTSSKSVQQ